MNPGNLTRLALAVVAASALGLGACSRTHITPTHGRAFREAFAIQDANPKGGNQLLMVSPNAGGGAGAQTLAPSIPSGN
jgi:hypothetical protein